MATISGAADLEPIVLSNNADWSEAQALVQDDGATAYPLPDGCTARMELRANAESAGVALLCTSETGELSFAPADAGAGDPYWWLVIEVPAERMGRVPEGEYLRDMLIFHDGQTIYGGRGEVAVVRGITRF